MYWQTSPGQTDLTYRQTMTITSGGTYYARIKNASGCWSTAASISASVENYPNGGSLSGGGSGYLTVSRTLVLSGYSGSIKEYRYKENGGGEVVVANTSPSLLVNFSTSASTITREYWAVLQSGGCLSNSSSTTVSAAPLPSPSYSVCQGDATSMSITRNIGCGFGTGSNAVFHGPSGGSISDPGGTESGFTVTWSTPGIYILKRTFPSQCGTSEIFSQSVEVLALPTAPSPAEVTQQGICRSMVLNYTGGVYDTYWQTSAGGRDETFRTTKTVTATGTYFARIKGSNGCWSNASSIDVSIPGVSAPSTSEVMQVLQCSGIVLLYKGTLDGYWQTTSDGESLSNQTQLNVTSAGNYYLRVKMSQDCWSDPLVIPITSQVLITPCPIVEFPDISYTCSSQQGYVVLSSDKVTDRWFQNATLGSPLSASNSIEVPVTVNTYYVETTSSRGQVFRVPYTIDQTFTSRCGEYLNSITSNKPTAELNTLTLLEPVSQLLRSITYFDGVGRSVQEIAIKGSPAATDVVRPIVYDQNGREFRKYLPFVSAESNGAFKTVMFNSVGNYTHNFYANTSDKIADDTRPFTETIFEQSPFNRPAQDFGVGQNWKDNNKFIQHQYFVNVNGTLAGQEQIIAWKVDASGLPIRDTAVNSFVSGGHYTTGQLNIKSTKDEQGNEVREYVDKEGRTILKKVQAVSGIAQTNNDTHWAMTYYIYDDFGNLSVVLPPEAVKAITAQ
jgi:hypothetical protein